MKLKISPPIIAVSLFASACASQVTTEGVAAAGPTIPETVTFNYDKGEVLSYILFDLRETEEAQAVRQSYFRQAFPLSRQFGLKRDVELDISQTVFGEEKGDGVSIFSFPDIASEKGLAAHPDWPAIKALRPAAWDELAVFNKELERPLTISFSPDKYYTLAIAEINPEAPEDYNIYMSGIESGLQDIGGRFVYRMINPSVEAHRDTFNTEVQVTLVEWTTEDAFRSFTTSPGYEAYSNYFTSGVSGFSFFQIKPKLVSGRPNA